MGRLKRRRSARPGVEGLERREAPASIAPAPQIVGVQRFGIHRQRSSIVLTFDQPMATGTSLGRRNFILQSRDSAGRFDGNPPQMIRIAAAVYDPATQSVRLFSARRLDPHREYLLTVNGNFAGLSSSQGIVLDGNNDGVPGGNAVILLGRLGPGAAPPG
jgi:hypothetical protein